MCEQPYMRAHTGGEQEVHTGREQRQVRLLSQGAIVYIVYYIDMYIKGAYIVGIVHGYPIKFV